MHLATKCISNNKLICMDFVLIIFFNSLRNYKLFLIVVASSSIVAINSTGKDVPIIS